jgi:hypothetical protein
MHRESSIRRQYKLEMPKAKKTTTKKTNIINLDDPTLVLPDIDFSDSDEDELIIKKNGPKKNLTVAKKIIEKLDDANVNVENININDTKNKERKKRFSI